MSKETGQAVSDLQLLVHNLITCVENDTSNMRKLKTAHDNLLVHLKAKEERLQESEMGRVVAERQLSTAMNQLEEYRNTTYIIQEDMLGPVDCRLAAAEEEAQWRRERSTSQDPGFGNSLRETVDQSMLPARQRSRIRDEDFDRHMRERTEIRQAMRHHLREKIPPRTPLELERERAWNRVEEIEMCMVDHR
jgi:hypothetical protein